MSQYLWEFPNLEITLQSQSLLPGRMVIARYSFSFSPHYRGYCAIAASFPPQWLPTINSSHDSISTLFWRMSLATNYVSMRWIKDYCLFSIFIQASISLLWHRRALEEFGTMSNLLRYLLLLYLALLNLVLHKIFLSSPLSSLHFR